MAEATCSIPGCDSAKLMARGWCSAHYKRWYRYGDPLATVNRRCPNGASPDQRLRYVGWTVVARRPGIGPCWEWGGLFDSAGYGRVWDGDRVMAVHRLAYLTWVGPLSDDEMVCHRCDNPPCLSPGHLFPGDGVTNAADMVAKRRSNNGERRPHVKLTDRQVAAIRGAYTGIRGQQAQLAQQYGVTPSRISVIVRGLARINPTNPAPN